MLAPPPFPSTTSEVQGITSSGKAPTAPPIVSARSPVPPKLGVEHSTAIQALQKELTEWEAKLMELPKSRMYRAEREEAKAKIKALEEAKKKKLHELEGKSVFT